MTPLPPLPPPPRASETWTAGASTAPRPRPTPGATRARDCTRPAIRAVCLRVIRDCLIIEYLYPVHNNQSRLFNTTRILLDL